MRGNLASIRYTPERAWFAWRPVRCICGTIAWLQTVGYCTRYAGGFGLAFSNVLYRKLDANGTLDGA